MSRTVFVLLAALFAFTALYVSSCTEPPPGEVIGRVTKGGTTMGVDIKVVNADGEVVAIGQTVDGVYSIGNIRPGTYTVQCIDREGTLLGEEEVVIEPDGSTNRDFTF